MPSTPSLPSPASAIAFLTASTAMARVGRPELRLYSVSPIPTRQYLSLSDPMGSPRGSGGRGLRPFDCCRGLKPWQENETPPSGLAAVHQPQISYVSRRE